MAATLHKACDSATSRKRDARNISATSELCEQQVNSCTLSYTVSAAAVASPSSYLLVLIYCRLSVTVHGKGRAQRGLNLVATTHWSNYNSVCWLRRRRHILTVGHVSAGFADGKTTLVVISLFGEHVIVSIKACMYPYNSNNNSVGFVIVNFNCYRLLC